jgi:hypothetical protein
MGNKIKWSFIIVIGFAIGIWYGFNESKFNATQSLFILAGSILILSILAVYGYAIYVLRFSRNMKEVGAYWIRLTKHPYYATMNDLINGRSEAGLSKLPLIKNPQLRSISEANLNLDLGKIHDARQATDLIRNSDIRHVNYAHIAMIQGDWPAYEHMKSKVKRASYRHALEADAAFRKHDFEEAKHLGDLAIEGSAGVQRYLYIRLLERQLNNPNRESYF